MRSRETRRAAEVAPRLAIFARTCTLGTPTRKPPETKESSEKTAQDVEARRSTTVRDRCPAATGDSMPAQAARLKNGPPENRGIAVRLLHTRGKGARKIRSSRAAS